MYCYGLKFAIWWGDKSVIWNWFLATKDIEHESNAFEAKHIISCKPLASRRSPYSGEKQLPVGGYLNLELCRFLLAIDDGPIRSRGLNHQLSAVWTLMNLILTSSSSSNPY